jgi:hypothetical protein
VGVGVGGMAVMMMNSVLVALATGSRATIARYIGARNEAVISTGTPFIGRLFKVITEQGCSKGRIYSRKITTILIY